MPPPIQPRSFCTFILSSRLKKKNKVWLFRARRTKAKGVWFVYLFLWRIRKRKIVVNKVQDSWGIRLKLLSIIILKRLILISNMGTFKFEYKCLIPPSKSSLKGMTIKGYRRGIKLIRIDQGVWNRRKIQRGPPYHMIHVLQTGTPFV